MNATHGPGASAQPLSNANHRPLPRRVPPAGFTLVEALVSISITAIAGSALLLGIASALQTTETVLEETIALGLAQQLMDEISCAGYAEAGAGGQQTVLGPEAGETAGGTRELFDDLDDYHGLAEQPPRDLWGVELGADDGEGDERHAAFQSPAAALDRWRREVEVYYVNATDHNTRLGAGATSDFRAVTVSVLVDTAAGRRQIVSLKRVVGYVPPP